MSKAKETLSIKIDNEKVKKVVLYLLAFFIPVVILIGIFIYLKVYPFGEGTYMPVDAYGQYIHFLQYFRDLFFGDSSIIYSLSKSIGGEMYGLFAYYLASPYNLITLFFQKGNITLAFDIILILKTASTSVTFTYYLNRRKKAKFTNLIFALMYTFSSYVITYGFNIMWLDAVILLPLVVAGIDDIVDNKKNNLYIVALTLTLITNYYIGFMVCIFSLIYFIYKIFISDLKDKKIILKKTGTFALHSVCAALIACIILVPVFIGLQDGRADFSFSAMNADVNFEIKNFISKFFTNSFNLEEIKNNSMPPVFCGVLANILLISYFLNDKTNIKELVGAIILFTIFILSFYAKGVNLLWSMGNMTAWYTYRYTFCFIFMFIVLAQKSFENMKDGLSTLKILLVGIIYLGISIFVFNLDLELINKDAVKLDMVLVVILCALLMLSRINFKETGGKIKRFLKKHYLKIITFIIFLISTANLIYNATYCMDIIREGASGVEQGIYAILVNIQDRITSNLKEYDNSLYRMEIKSPNAANNALTYEYNGISYSGSTYSKSLHSFLKKLGMRGSHVQVVYNIESTKTIDMLLGVKYVVIPLEKAFYKNYPLEYEDEYIVESKVQIYKNPYCLSLGYAINEETFNTNMDNDNTFELQNEMLKNMTGIDEKIYTRHEGEISETNEGLEKNGVEYKNIEENAKITYEFTIESTDNAYMYVLGDSSGGASICVNGEETASHPTFIANEMINIGKREIGEKVTVEIKPSKDININDIYIYYENEEVLEKHYNKLSTTQVDMEKINNKKYKGKVNIENDSEYIMFTIPYEKGWKISVDGKEIEYEEVLDQLIAINLEQGEHEILLEYTPTGLILGAILTLIGLILFAQLTYKKKRSTIASRNGGKTSGR